MKIVLLAILSALLVSSLAIYIPKADAPVITQELVDEINSAGTTWTAGLNERSAVAGATKEKMSAILGVLPGGPKLPTTDENFGDLSDLPESFDSATNWPNCPSISQIRDQSACGSCWAFGAVSAISDRTCIAFGTPLVFSTADMTFCCRNCGFGCNGGYPSAAWQYWVNNGVTEEACYPYPFPSCDHHIPGSSNPCPSKLYPDQPCPNACTNKTWDGPAWKNNKHFGAKAYSVYGAKQIQAEIMKHGPVEGSFSVYSDFPTYKSGVYRRTSGSYLGGHAIKIVGWGVEHGTPYWLCANSWNENWGDKGYFKILRGSDECGIERGVVAGLPKN